MIEVLERIRDNVCSIMNILVCVFSESNTWMNHSSLYGGRVFLVPFEDFFIHFPHFGWIESPQAAFPRVCAISIGILNLLKAFI